MGKESLKYTDERDKAYGIAGMAIALVACDGEHLLSEISLDDSDGSNMHISSAVTAESNPNISAKVLWSQSVKDLRAVTSMALGNIACRRRMITPSTISANAVKILHDVVREQASVQCSLDTDEADALFENCRSYVKRLFDHNAVQEIARRFSERIIERRTMSSAEVIEFLASMGLR